MTGTHQQLDPLVLGRRLRHHRRERGMTLDQLGAAIGRPAPYLSLLENGKKEPRINLVLQLAQALEVDMSELLDPRPPNRRDALEIALLRSQDTALFDSLDLPAVKPSAKLDNETLTHLVGLHDALRERSKLGSAGSDEVRRANGEVTAWLRQHDGYLPEVEAEARRALASSGYPGEGPFSSRNLLDLTDRAGFAIHPVEDMPSFARSVIDLDHRRVYIAQRDELRTRQARKAVLQTLAGFLLGHETNPDLDTFLRQRVETAYFAAAVLAPEDAVVSRLQAAKENHDIDVEDVKELFYLSYEMAAWRTVNLATRHLGIRAHLLVSDRSGAVVKAYANDEAPIPRDEHGGMETQRLCRRWGARRTFDSAERYGTHHQFTDTPEGTFFCTTHVEAGREHSQAVTIGVPFAEARWLRGRDTENRETSTCPDPGCCRMPEPELAGKWSDKVIVSARSQSRILGLLAPDPYPELDMPQVLELVEAHSRG
ncbi:MAG TPA: helix-turn-helix domain-containing protein [Acidimicrobiia bacterium]|nr:helix-turn-helix domain-containing protein [Acidimicrobiia bacterium]